MNEQILELLQELQNCMVKTLNLMITIIDAHTRQPTPTNKTDAVGALTPTPTENSATIPAADENQRAIMQTVAQQLGWSLEVTMEAIYRHWGKYPSNPRSVAHIVEILRNA